MFHELLDDLKFRNLGNFKKITEMLIQWRAPSRPPNRNILTLVPENREKAAVKHFIEKPILLNFGNLSTIPFPMIITLKICIFDILHDIPFDRTNNSSLPIGAKYFAISLFSSLMTSITIARLICPSLSFFIICLYFAFLTERRIYFIISIHYAESRETKLTCKRLKVSVWIYT